MSKRKNPPRLDIDDAISLQNTCESEGFDYAFRFYSSFKEIKDKKFHSLRKAYVKAAQALSDYCRLEEDLVCEGCGATLEDGACPRCADRAADETCPLCGDTLEDGDCPTCCADPEIDEDDGN
jgi:rubrerythrin